MAESEKDKQSGVVEAFVEGLIGGVVEGLIGGLVRGVDLETLRAVAEIVCAVDAIVDAVKHDPVLRAAMPKHLERHVRVLSGEPAEPAN